MKLARLYPQNTIKNSKFKIHSVSHSCACVDASNVNELCPMSWDQNDISLLFFCLLNPTKTELGLISKNIIKKITDNLLIPTSTNLCKDQFDTIKWFTNMRNKNKATFIKFHIIDFQSSITRGVLVNSINFAKNCIEITTMKLISS